MLSPKGRRWIGAWMASVVLLAAGCSCPPTMHVEIDLFSGRPNPTWELDSGGAAELRTLLAGLPRSDQPAPEPPGLGYRGFRVTDENLTYHVYRTWVRVDSQTLSDPDRKAERWLVDHLPQDLRALVSSLI